VSFITPCEACNLPLDLYDITNGVFRYRCATNHWWEWSVRTGQLKRIGDVLPGPQFADVLWTPRDLPYGRGFYDARTSFASTAYGTEIVTWPDLSGKGNTLTAGASNRPHWDTVAQGLWFEGTDTMTFALAPTTNEAGKYVYNDLTGVNLWLNIPTIAEARDFATNTTYHWAGLRQALVLYDDVQTSAADKDRIAGWLAHSYGYQTQLPVDHPYRTNPPLSGRVAI